jgi:hypothetical protein
LYGCKISIPCSGIAAKNYFCLIYQQNSNYLAQQWAL